jgi:hypothetical protein
MCGFDASTLVPDWDLVLEAHQRRNVLIHHGGRADRAYLQHLPPSRTRPSLGEPLVIDQRYVLDVVYSLRALGSGLATLWPRLLAGDADPPRLSSPTELVVELMQARRWAEALRVAQTLRMFEPDAQTNASLQINEWLARRELAGTPNDIKHEVAAWNPPDDSPRWQFAVALLLRRSADAEIALATSDARGIPRSTYRGWPLVDLAEPALKAQIVGRPGRSAGGKVKRPRR